MSGKRAKQLRRMAEQNSIDKADRDIGYVERVRLTASKNKAAGKTYQAVNIPGTTHSEEKRLKREYKQSRSNPQ